MGSTFELTVQRAVGAGMWPVVAEYHRAGQLLPVRSEGELRFAAEPVSARPRTYGEALGRALFTGPIRDAYVAARGDPPVRVWLCVEDPTLRTWRWEWLCGPLDSTGWDFLSLDQRALYSLYLPSLTDRPYPPIGRRDLRALVVVANPSDPDGHYGLTTFDAPVAVSRVKAVFTGRLSHDVLARTPGAIGPPTLDALVTQLTTGAAEGPYSVLHLVCHGRFDREADETWVYLERPVPDATGAVLAEGIAATTLIERLRRVRQLPHFVFLSVCESGAPEAEQRFGGLAQRLVRELGIPAVVGMTEPVTVATAHALSEAFYTRLLQPSADDIGAVDRALVEAYAGLASRLDIHVPALYSRLGDRPLFSPVVDRELTGGEIRAGLAQVDALLAERAPVLQPEVTKHRLVLEPWLSTAPTTLSADARQIRAASLQAITEICQEALDISFHALVHGRPLPEYDVRQPFRGLSPFRPEDHEFFFGRDALINTLLRKLSDDPFLPVLGPSGSGKSSVVLAGLVPRLQHQQPDLHVAYLTPGSTPLEQLNAVQATVANERVLYVVDQFEEVFTACRDEAQRRAFVDAVLGLTTEHRVVLTMRADFWGECARYAALRARMQARQELIAPMTTTELRSAMEQQAAKVALRFEADLSQTMLDEVAGEPGAMPLLQHALLELWKRRHGRWLRAAEYRALGGVKQAIAKTADRLYAELTAGEQGRMRDIFLRLTQLDQQVAPGEERRDTRRRVPFSELVPAGTDPEATKRLVKQFADAVLVTTSRNPLSDQDEVEVAHEALIRYWARLQGWLNEHRERLGLRQSVADAAANWIGRKGDLSFLTHRGARLEAAEELKAHLQLTTTEMEYLVACRAVQEDELERAKTTAAKLRRRAALLGLLLVLTVASGVIASLQWTAAERQGREAYSREVAASAVSFLTIDPELSLLLSAEAVGIEPTTQSELALRQALFLSRVRAVTRWDTDNEWDPAGRPRTQSLFDATGLKIVTTMANDARVWSARDGRHISEFKGHSGRVNRAVFSSDGRFVATASTDRSVRIWEAASGTQLKQFGGHSGEVETVEFSPDGKLVVSAGDDAVYLWNARTEKSLRKFEDTRRIHTNPPLDLLGLRRDPSPKPMWVEQREQMKDATFSRDGRLLATLNSSGVAKIYRLSDLTVLRQFDGDHTFGYAFTFSPDSSQIVVSGADGTAKLWDIATGRLLHTFTHADAVTCVAFSPDGRWVATGSQDRTARIWEVNTGVLQAELRARDIITDVSFSGDSRFVVTASVDATARVWDVRGRRELLQITGHRGAVTSARFSPDGKSIVTASGDILSKSGRLFYTVSGDKTSRLWNVSTNALVSETPVEHIYRIVPSPTRKRFATISSNGVRVWNAVPLQPLTNHLSASSEDLDAVFSPDEAFVVVWHDAPLSGPLTHMGTLRNGRFDASTLADIAEPNGMKVRVFEVATGTKLLESETISHRITTASFSPDGDSFALADPAGGVLLHSLRQANKQTGLTTGESAPLTMAYLDGRTMLALGTAKGGLVLDLATNRVLRTFPIPTKDIERVVFATDRKRFALASGREVEVRTSQSGDTLLTAKANQINDVTFGSAGKNLLIGDHDGKLRVWDVTARRQIAEFQAHLGNVNTAWFDSDDAIIATSSEDGTARIWESRTGVLIGEVTADSEVIGTFIDDQNRLVVGARSGKLSLHECGPCLPLEELKRLATARLTRSLTPDERARYLHNADAP